MAISIDLGRIVWVNDPYRCGQSPNLTTFRNRLKSLLDPRENVVAVSGYLDERCVQAKDIPPQWCPLRSKIRARRECINRRFKQFSALATIFRHYVSKYSLIFHAIANFIHLPMKLANDFFDIDFQ